MAAWLRVVFVTVLLAGCASAPPTGTPPLPPAEPSSQSPSAKKLPERRTAPAPRTSPKPVAAVDEENNVFFTADLTTIDSEEKPKLQRHVQRLKADPKLVLMLIGHTDDQGSRSYKLAVAEQRLDAVFKLLRSQGVPARQLRRYPVGREMTNPGCGDADCRDQMRRVELVYLD